MMLSNGLTDPEMCSRAITISLCVIGCGPTGIAALYEASLLGLDAIGVEAGSGPLANMRVHLEGMSYVSPASDFEVAGLPLDCQHAQLCTREDVAHYFTKLVNWGGLDIRARWRCVGMEPSPQGVKLLMDTPAGFQQVLAQNVVVTSWYKHRPWTGATPPFGGVPRVHEGFVHPIELAGQRVVIVGGGLSSYEYATTLMLTGASLFILARGPRKGLFHRPEFQTMLAATGSEFRDQCTAIDLVAGGVSVFDPMGATIIPCDDVVFAAGRVLDDSMLRVLVDAGIVEPETAARLATAPTFEDADRARPGATAEERVEVVEEGRPDLWRYLFEGVLGVRLAGGVLHGGGQHAGLAASIATSRLAVRAILGAPAPSWPRPLTRALADPTLVRQEARGALDDSLICAVIPVARRLMGRTWLPHPGIKQLTARDLRPFDGSADAQLLAAADGHQSLGALLRATGLAADTPIPGSAEGEDDVDNGLTAFRRLCHGGALTWLPPRQSLAASAKMAQARGSQIAVDSTVCETLPI